MSVEDLDGESGDVALLLASSAILCWIIWSNLSTKRSLASLACKMCRSSIVNRGINDKSIELTASYKDSKVSRHGALKYSSRANNKRGLQEVSLQIY